MSDMDVDKEVRELKRRLDLAETRLSQLEGRFEIVSGEVRFRLGLKAVPNWPPISERR